MHEGASQGKILNATTKVSVLGLLFAALLCPLSSPAQETPLATPNKTVYPGIIETFEKLIQIDSEKFSKRQNILLKNGRIFSKVSEFKELDLEPDFLNSIILHSDPGYIRLASVNQCRLYDGIITDLLRSAEGKIKNVLVTFMENNQRQSALIGRKDFLASVVNKNCPDSVKNIAAFQVKTLSETLSQIKFEIPTGIDQCRNIHVNWLADSRTPYLCQMHDFLKEAKSGGGDPKDLEQRKSLAKIIETKLTLVQREYLENLCRNLDDEEVFCDEFLNVSFWTKIAGGFESKIYVDDICSTAQGSSSLSNQQYSICLDRLKKEQDLCLYPAGSNTGLRPQPECNQLSLALNHSSLNANYKDCPGNSDQLIVTNMSRIINHFNGADVPTAKGPCQSISAYTSYSWNKKLDNEESWKVEACYDDKLLGREVCTKAVFGSYPDLPESYTNVVANILKKTRGADQQTTCEMIDAGTYNPILLQFKSGCYIIYEKNNCYISQCKHKIVFNDRPIDFVRIKNRATMAYFPLNVRDERYSQHYVLSYDFKKRGKQISSLNSILAHLKRSRNALIHGVGCAEDLIPSFVKAEAMNQCTPLPFIVNGVVQENNKQSFVIRTAADSLQAPRLVSWSTIYSGVKSYQKVHPLKLWTMHGLD